MSTFLSPLIMISSCTWRVRTTRSKSSPRASLTLVSQVWRQLPFPSQRVTSQTLTSSQVLRSSQPRLDKGGRMLSLSSTAHSLDRGPLSWKRAVTSAWSRPLILWSLIYKLIKIRRNNSIRVCTTPSRHFSLSMICRTFSSGVCTPGPLSLLSPAIGSLRARPALKSSMPRNS